MKKKVGIIVALIAVVGLGVAGYWHFNKSSSVPGLVYKIDAKKEAAQSLARLVPNNVVAYYSLSNIETTWTQLRNSDFWKQFSSLSLWDNPTFQTSLRTFQDSFKTNFGFPLGEGTIMDIAGKELAIAVLPMDENAPQPKVLLLTQVGNKAKVLEKLFKIMEQSANEENSTIETIQHGSAEITKIKSSDENGPLIHYTIIGNTAILSVGEALDAIKNAIDITNGKSTDSLALNAKFQHIIKTTTLGSNTVGRFYMDFSEIGSFIKAVSAIPGGTPIAPNVADAFKILKTLGGTTVLEKNLITRISVIPNRENMDAQTKAMWNLKPLKPTSLEFVPAGTYLYTASCSLDVNSLWNIWLSNIDGQNPQQAQLIKDGIKNFEQAIGVEIENDILSWIGNEAAFVFNEVSTKGLFPIPKLAVLIKVKNKKKAEALLSKLVDSVNKQAATLAQTASETGAAPGPLVTGFKLNISQEKYKGAELNILEIPFLGKALAPGYAFVGDFLILSTNTASLQKMIDTSKGETPSLKEDPDFKTAAPFLGSKTNQLVYANVSKILDASVEISNWIVSFQALQPEAAEGQNNQQFIQEGLIPLLKSLKALKVIGINTVYTSEGIEQTFVTKFE